MVVSVALTRDPNAANGHTEIIGEALVKLGATVDYVFLFASYSSGLQTFFFLFCRILNRGQYRHISIDSF